MGRRADDRLAFSEATAELLGWMERWEPKVGEVGVLALLEMASVALDGPPDDEVGGDR